MQFLLQQDTKTFRLLSFEFFDVEYKRMNKLDPQTAVHRVDLNGL